MSKRIWLSLFLLVVNFVIVLSLVAGMQPDGAVPAAISRDFETAVHNDIAAAEYVVSWQDNGQGAIPAGYQAPNRRQQFRTYFMDDGIMVTPRDAQDDAWTWGLRLIAAGDIEIGGETAVLTADQNQITYNRGRFSEWYHNSERGLEQGFTILSPLSDDPMLHIDLAVTGSLRPAMSEDGSAVHFVLPQGGTILRYSDLVAFDASGEMLSASMSVVELDDAQQAVRLSVDTVAAAYPITIDPLTSSDAQWRPFINQDGNFGFSVRDAGDVNGDGFDDVIVGANWFDGGQNNEGAAFLYYGSANGLSQVFGWKAESNIALAEMGYAVSTAGDINDDFYDDLIIGAPGYNGTGAAMIFLGGPGGPAATPDIVLAGEQDASRFGHAVSTAGYVNDDFFADVIVGAPEYDAGSGPNEGDEGRAYVYYGNNNGVSSSPDWIAEIGDPAAPNSFFGHSVDTAGDFDRNGFDDVVIGAPYYAPDGETGLVAVFPGSNAGLPMTWNGVYSDTADFNPSELGYSVAGAGDVDGDGFDDVIVGAPVYDDDFQAPGFEGAAYLYLGATERFSGTFTTYDTVILPSQLDSRFGHAVDGAGDVNRDGYDDLIIGAPQYDDTSVDDGAAFLYLGNTDFFWSGFDVGYFGDQSGSVFGTAVSTAGDANGDRYDDFVVGAPKQLTPISTVGQAFGFYGYGPIAGLTAVNNSPALKNEAVQFAATISAGGHVDYDWDFGDGNGGSGAKPLHSYSEPGLYNAVVTASNPLSVMTATTTVSVTVDSLITPEDGGEVIFTNEQGQGTTVNVPPGAVNSVLSLSYTPLNENDLTQPKPTTSTNYYFDLGPETPRQIFLPIVMNGTGGTLVSASVSDGGESERGTTVAAACPAGHFCFLKPVTFTIFYNEDLLPVGAVETELKLTFWDEASSKWVDAATTCDPTSTYHYFPAQDFYTVEVCHLSRFAVIH